MTTAGAARLLGSWGRSHSPEAIGENRDAPGPAREAQNGPTVAQITGLSPPSLRKIEWCKRGLPHEDWRFLESQSGISGSNETIESNLSVGISITYDKSMAEEEAPVKPAVPLQLPRAGSITRTGAAPRYCGTGIAGCPRCSQPRGTSSVPCGCASGGSRSRTCRPAAASPH